MSDSAALAQEAIQQGVVGAAVRQFLTFTIGDEEYGVDIMVVREVKGWTETTRLPNAPHYVRGVMNLRGIIIPIFDLRARFTGVLTQPDAKHVVIILAMGDRNIGILADTVSDILTVAEHDIKAAPETETQVDRRFVSGLIAVDSRMVVVLEIDKLLRADDMEIVDSQGTK